MHTGVSTSVSIESSSVTSIVRRGVEGLDDKATYSISGEELRLMLEGTACAVALAEKATRALEEAREHARSLGQTVAALMEQRQEHFRLN